MIDLKLLQKDFDGVSAKLKRKGVSSEILESLKEKFEELNSKLIDSGCHSLKVGKIREYNGNYIEVL